MQTIIKILFACFGIIGIVVAFWISSQAMINVEETASGIKPFLLVCAKIFIFANSGSALIIESLEQFFPINEFTLNSPWNETVKNRIQQEHLNRRRRWQEIGWTYCLVLLLATALRLWLFLP